MPTNLSPFQLAIQSAVGKGKGAGARLTSDMAGRIADQLFGSAPVTPGSQILYQDAVRVRWRDPDGYEHEAQRSLDGRDPSAGQWRINTNRPNVMPASQGEQNLMSAIGQRLQSTLGGAPALAQLDPQTLALLDAIDQAERARNQQQGQTAEGQLLARLYGSGMNQSSVGNQAAAEFAKQLGFVTQQQQADAAARRINLQQYLSQLGQQQTETGAGLYGALSGQGTQRSIAGGNIELALKQLAESARQANQGFELGQQNADLQLAQSRSLMDKILKGSQIFANIVGGASGGLSAYNALLPRRGTDLPKSSYPTFGFG